MTTSLVGKDLITTREWTREQLDELLSLATRMRTLDHEGADLRLCRGELAYALFFDNSTRTKSAFAGAASRLGMQPVIVDGGSTQLSHGETAEETGAMLAMNAHVLGVRHDRVLGGGTPFMRALARGTSQWLAEEGSGRQVPLVNLQCDLDHPTQTLADLAFLQQRLGGVEGKEITVSWAYSPSYAKPLSVPQGLLMLLKRFGANVTLACPEGYELEAECMEGVTVSRDMDAAFNGAHVVYPKSWGPRTRMLARADAEAQGNNDAVSEIEQACLAQNALHRDWICDERRMAMTRDAVYMHCLPADIGDEVTAGVMKAATRDVWMEASWKVYVIMASIAAAKGLGGAL